MQRLLVLWVSTGLVVPAKAPSGLGRKAAEGHRLGPAGQRHELRLSSFAVEEKHHDGSGSGRMCLGSRGVRGQVSRGCGQGGRLVRAGLASMPSQLVGSGVLSEATVGPHVWLLCSLSGSAR